MAPGGAIAPVTLSVESNGDAPVENGAIRTALDKVLAETGNNPCSVSGMLVFPYDLWVSRGRPEYSKFRPLCVDRFYERLRKLDSRNAYGTYFERMMRFRGMRNGKSKEVDQVKMIIDLLRRGRRPRESALQLCCFDPAKDHTGQAVRGFPCLHSVSIGYDEHDDLYLTALYPTQYIVERAYGNYFGLFNLGRFIAHQTERKFKRMTCISIAPRLGDVTKSKLRALAAVVQTQVDATGGN